MAGEQALLDSPETPEVETPEPSLRETISAAIEEHAEPEQSPTPQPVEQPVTPPVQAPGPQGEPPAKVATPQGKPAAAAGKPVLGPDGKPVQTPAELKAPSAWKPTAREKWNTLPREVQEEINRRESDNLRLIGSVGTKVAMANAVAQHLEPFAERLQSNGVAPAEFLGEVFSSVKILAQGTPQEKVAVVANMIQSYGIDLRALDAELTGRIQTPAEVHQARQLAGQAQRVIQRTTEQQRQAQLHESEVQAEKVLASFAADPKNEFYEDVRDLMADLIASKQVKTLAEAYQSAVWANPDTRKILLQREAAARAQGRQQRANVARTASSSVSGQPRGQPANPLTAPGASLRDTIAAAWDQAEDAAA